MKISPLEQRLSTLLDKRQQQSKLRSLKSSPPGSVDFSSNDFLSLSTNPQYRRDFLAALGHKDLPLGSTGSRLLDGNSDLAEALEHDIAAFHHAEAGLLTNSGFDANVSIFAFLPQPEDVIVYDELIHASVHDGMRQSRAKQRLAFKHNDVGDLGRILESCAVPNSSRNVFVAVETVYSMEGDLAPLSEIVNLIESLFPSKNAYLVVDEAHATGIYGPNGSGRVCELGLESKVPIRLHTFGKALASNGAIILCSPVIRLYLVNYARPLIYTTFMSYPTLIGIQTAYDWLKRGKSEALAANLYRLVRHFHTQVETLSDLISPSTSTAPFVRIPAECPESPILAILTSKPRSLAAYCQNAGFVVRPVVAPTVPSGTERVRVCLHASNTVKQIDDFVDCVRRWMIQQKLNPGAFAAQSSSRPENRPRMDRMPSTRSQSVGVSSAKI